MIEELNDLFMQVKDAEPEYENVPDGEYLAVLENAEYKMSKNDRPMVQFTYKITDGEYKDKIHNKFMILNGKDETQLSRNLNRYGTELKKYGIIATSLTDSFEQLKSKIGTEVKLTITTKDEYTNTSIELI